MRSLWAKGEKPDRSEPLERAFSERIMLAVTQVNDCRFCDYGHSRAALRAGVAEHELAAIKAGDFNGTPEYETPALHFAQHYAAAGGTPDAEALNALVQTYGGARAARILLVIRMITIANLLGNTFDALLYRLKGHPVASGSVLQESSVLLLALLSMPLFLLVGLGGMGSRLLSKAAFLHAFSGHGEGDNAGRS
jgi:AhpD family alkylhydroperoxidase